MNQVEGATCNVRPRCTIMSRWLQASQLGRQWCRALKSTAGVDPFSLRDDGEQPGGHWAADLQNLYLLGVGIAP